MYTSGSIWIRVAKNNHNIPPWLNFDSQKPIKFKRIQITQFSDTNQLKILFRAYLLL